MSRSDARFWNLIAKSYFKKPIKDNEAYQIKLKTTQEYLHRDMDVLEIGCGTGGTALTHAPHVRHIRATDVASRMIEIANTQKIKHGVTNVDFDQATLDDVVREDNRYDAVLALSVLHLLEDPQTAISQIKSVLKPQGVLVANTPCLTGKLGPMGPVLRLGHFIGLLPRINSFSENELTTWLERKGFKIVHHWQPQNSDSVFTIAVAPNNIEDQS